MSKRYWRPYLWLISAVSVFVPRRLRAEWRREWEAELLNREETLTKWRKKVSFDLLKHSTGSVWDALWLQPRRWEDEMFQDLRFGVRMLWKNPGFTLVAVLTLALGIGANTAIFSVVYAALLRPLPYPDAGQLVQVKKESSPAWFEMIGGGEIVSGGEFLEWRDHNQVFSRLAAYGGGEANLTGMNEAERIAVGRVSADFFPLLGIQPAIGRSFIPEEDRPSGEHVVVLGHGIWQSRFGGDALVVRRTLTLDDKSHTIIGVLPPTFHFPEPYEMWVPLALDEGAVRAGKQLTLLRTIARLEPGVTMEAARADLNAITRAAGGDRPPPSSGGRVQVITLREQFVGAARLMLLVLLAAVGFLLLIACANVANLLLARAAVRRREIAVRLALGASRWRIVRQLLTESTLLSLLGAAAGALVAVWGVGAMRTMGVADLASVQDIGVDAPVLGFTLLISLANGLLFGLAPALQASRPEVSEWLKEGAATTSGGRARQRLRSLLVISEIALSLVLLIGAGLIVRSFVRLLSVDPGFRPEGALTMQITLSESRYDGQRRAEFFRQLLERLGGLPDVRAVGAIDRLPLGNYSASIAAGVDIEGAPQHVSGKQLPIAIAAVAGDYFRAMGIQLKRGRAFNEHDDATAAQPVVIVNETFAEQYFGSADPVGKRVSGFGPDGEWLTIVGVVGDVRQKGLDREPEAEIYWPYSRAGGGRMSVVLRTEGDPRSLVATARAAVRALDPHQPVHGVMTMEQRLAGSYAPRRSSMLLLGIFAVLALMLAAVGIYGVMSYAVAQRTHEIGIRMALGARAGDVLKLVVVHGLVLTLTGAVIGLTAALGLTKLMSSMLYEVSATDPLTFVLTATLLVVVALLACYLPARRATKVDPLVALRYE